MANTGFIRHRLVFILVLGMVTSALSLYALVRVLSLSESQRLERAQETVSSELDRFIELAPASGALVGPPSTSFVGMRGGWLKHPDELVPGLPASWQQPLHEAVTQSAAKRRTDPAAHTMVHVPYNISQLVIGVAPTPTGNYAWAGVEVLPSKFLRPWRYIGYAIAFATLLLVGASLYILQSFRRETHELQLTVEALGKDLQTPVPRPQMAELAALAEGVSRMANDLQTSRDDTARLGQELAQKERLAALGRVAAGVAHEVRNPLASIKLRLDLTAATQDVPEATRKAVVAASQEIARLDRLVADLLVVAGRHPGPRHDVDLRALTEARIELLHPWAEQRGVTISAEGDGHTIADPEALARAIDNLLRNAIEASPVGGTVTARVHESSGEVSIRVEDPGPGVDPARAAQLFEPFFTTKPEGTGLGLALSRSIARAHGGDLVYARGRDRTCFEMRLQRAPVGVAA